MLSRARLRADWKSKSVGSVPARPSGGVLVGAAVSTSGVAVRLADRFCYAAGAKRWPLRRNSPTQGGAQNQRLPGTVSKLARQAAFGGIGFGQLATRAKYERYVPRRDGSLGATNPPGIRHMALCISYGALGSVGQHETTIRVPNRLLRLTEFRFNLGYSRDTLLKLVNLSLIDLDSARLGCVRSRCCGCCDYVGYDTARQEQSAAKQGDWQDNGMPTHLLFAFPEIWNIA